MMGVRRRRICTVKSLQYKASGKPCPEKAMVIPYSVVELYVLLVAVQQL